MYPHHVFDLEPAGTFGVYPICYQWVSGRYFQPEPAMYSRCFHWFPGPLAPSERQRLEMMTSSHRTRRNKVVQRERVKRTESAPQTFNSLVDRLGQRIGCIGIVMGSPSVLDIVSCLELLETLHTGIVNVLGIGNKLRRRGRSVGSRHFDVEDRSTV